LTDRDQSREPARFGRSTTPDLPSFETAAFFDIQETLDRSNGFPEKWQDFTPTSPPSGDHLTARLARGARRVSYSVNSGESTRLAAEIAGEFHQQTGRNQSRLGENHENPSKTPEKPRLW
jgi:hypothetical protein